MLLLAVERVSKTYGVDTVAVRDVSLNVESGEIVCLLGPSGCGKTTLLRMIAGLERPDAGTVSFNGRVINDVPPHRRGFGMMFQDFALFPHKNVRDNIIFGLRMKNMPAAEIQERLARALALVEMEAFAEREISQLSGGEQQRVALARALAPGPQLLMLDEPLGALDRALRERLMLDLRAILKRVGMTALYVTHDQTEAFAISDRMAVMNLGEIVQIGPPREVHDRPATPFVAQFLGFQNLLPGTVDSDGLVETVAGHFRLAASPPATGSAVMLLIKPEIDNALKSGEEPTAVNMVEGVVESVTFRGRYSQIWLRAGDERLLFEDAGELALNPGETARIPIAADQLLLYES